MFIVLLCDKRIVFSRKKLHKSYENTKKLTVLYGSASGDML